MTSLIRTVSVLTTAALLTACGGNGDPGPGGPPPGECRETITGDLTIPTVLENGPEDCDYFFPGGTGGANYNYRVTSDLEIEPGTVLRFGQNAMLYVMSEGSLTAVGTADARITFEGAQAVDGYWFGVCFVENRESRFEHVDIRSAGQAWAPAGTACKGAIAGQYPGGAAVHINDTTVSGSYVSGLSVHDLTLGEFSNNAFFGNRGYGVVVEAAQVHRLDTATDYLGSDSGAQNGLPYVYAAGHISDPDEPHIWRNLNAPYLATWDERHDYGSAITIADGATLVIDAGTTMVFDGDSELYVYGGSALGIGGTPENPVILTGLNEQRGSWNGVRISNSAAILQNVEIHWGGRNDIYTGSLYFVEIGTDTRGKQLENVFIDGSANCALVIEHEDTSVFDPLDVHYGSNNEEEFCTR